MSPIAVLSALLFYAALVLGEEDILAMLQEYRRQCLQETGFKDSMASAKLEDMPEQEKCYIACLAQKDGELSKDGLNIERVKENMHKLFKDDSKVEEVIRVMEICTKEVKVMEDNLCETAYQYLLCEQRMSGTPI